ncbi:sulfotransferase family protein [Pararhodobacter marinus]|uniref:Sulfotransferase family protein n=1 Tax=Pararhodobacter marinus TaxID=2184063 RepID=A0A2U2C8A1_9RHOB|nr:sulfotransferase family protein [Pararhodobacter marinus]
MRIAMWSGPRNLSTAMMYAFAARGDCTVSDEPFYAAYLAKTGLEHPMRAEVMASQHQDPAQVARDLQAETDQPLWYQKHMTQHMLDGVPLDWMAACRHAFLIRHPARVVASYLQKRERPDLAELGFQRQVELFDRVAQQTGTAPPVLDSTALRADPEGRLRALCAALGIGWRPQMLHWSAGPKAYDGVWAAHWYNAVHRSTGFEVAEGPLPQLDDWGARLAEAALPAYRTMAAHAL